MIPSTKSTIWIRIPKVLYTPEKPNQQYRMGSCKMEIRAEHMVAKLLFFIKKAIRNRRVNKSKISAAQPTIAFPKAEQVSIKNTELPKERIENIAANKTKNFFCILFTRIVINYERELVIH